ncbi:uncharacterized protein LOC143612938 [Bidens hawaiensis]|uniref:uncharacterized protein LOC143612938 n=1 Tax=Bidens hawaiensis TaxID=980011 RepID=UPI00404B0B19
MDNNKNLAASIKPPIKGLINNENKLNPEMGSNLKSPKTKQLPVFMNPTISASIKASGPKRKILGERNETLETLEQSSLEQSSFGSSVVDSNNGEPSLQPYDPVKNYLSPRPKYLRYNPDRRRKVLNLRENDVGRVEISAVDDSCSVQESVDDSCTERESVEEADDVNDEECESEYEDEDEDGWFRLKGVFKFVLAVIAVILTAHAICSMKCPTDSESLDWSASVYGLNFSEVGYGPVMEPGFLVGILKEDVFKTDEVFVHPEVAENDVSNVIEDESIEEFVEVKNVKTDEEEFDDSNVIEDESIEEFVEVQNAKVEAENDDSNAIEEAENDDLNVIQDEAVDDIIVNQDGVIEEDAADANDIEIANEMEHELDDIKTNDSLIKFTTFDLTVAT